MKKLVLVIMLAFVMTATLAVVPDSSEARRRRRHYHRTYVVPYWEPYPYYYPYYYEPLVVVPSPQVIIREQAPPTAYIEKGQPAPTEQAGQYWYYCEKDKSYFPYVKECPEGWLKVVPQTTPPSAK